MTPQHGASAGLEAAPPRAPGFVPLEGRGAVPDLTAVRRAHLVGIGGAAMTPLATILLQMGVRVTGSDLVAGPSLSGLRQLGAEVFLGHRAEQVGNAEVVIISSAVSETNPEVAAARRRGVPVVKHARALGALMRPRRGIAVAGTHGKSTTSALVAVVLESAGLAPTFHVGAEVRNYGCFGRLGRGDFLVAEADEFDRRFLEYEPEAAIVTGVEPDHLDYFGSFQAVRAAFAEFLERVRPGGVAVLCADDPVASTLGVGNARRVSYGFSTQADWRIAQWAPRAAWGSWFEVRAPDGRAYAFETQLVGRHNAANATAVVALASGLGVPMDAIRAGLAAFQGTRRRFEVVGDAGGVTVVDDYAHHPTAIRATLAAARAHVSGTLWAVFQPHTAHRTQSLLPEFSRAFAEADHVLITPTYRPAGREAPGTDPSVDALVAAMVHPDARALSAPAAVAQIARAAAAGDLVLVMGAGDIWTIEAELLSRLARRSDMA